MRPKSPQKIIIVRFLKIMLKYTIIKIIAFYEMTQFVIKSALDYFLIKKIIIKKIFQILSVLTCLTGFFFSKLLCRY